MPEIQHLIRSIAVVESPSTHCKNLENYLHICVINENHSTPIDVPDLLPTQITTPEIFHIIHIAANIQLRRYDIISRWLALVGKPPLDVSENYKDWDSSLARRINPH